MRLKEYGTVHFTDVSIVTASKWCQSSMSIYKHSMLSEVNWLCVNFTPILVTGEVCLKSLYH